MSRAKKNPKGLDVSGHDAVLVRVGQYGKHTHLYNPKTRLHACKSGFNAGRRKKDGSAPNRARGNPALFRSEGTHITCYRCIKIALMNLESTGSVMP